MKSPDKETVRSALIVVLALFVLAALSGKALHIDDPLFVACARRIMTTPLDPYGSVVNWYGSREPMCAVMRNPPLTCYYLAAVGALFSLDERALHLALLLPAALLLTGTCVLARQLKARPSIAVAVVASSSAFLVSGTNVMSDVLSAAWWVWSIVLWRGAIERRTTRDFAAASVCVTGALLTKYVGIAIVPLLLAWTGWQKQLSLRACLCLACPLLLLAAYEWCMHARHGSIALADAVLHTMGSSSDPAHGFARGVIGVAFLGGGFLGAGVLWLQFQNDKVLSAAVVASVGALILVFLATSSFDAWPQLKGASESHRLILAFELVLQVAVGGTLLCSCVLQSMRTKDPADLMVALWLVGVWIFSTYLNWGIAVRNLLPASPAIAVLVGRSRGVLESSPRRNAARTILLSIVGIASVLIAKADFDIASAARTASLNLVRAHRRAGQDVWFQGHWGFQYYAELEGARPMESKGDHQPKSGDVVLVPMLNTNVSGVPRDRVDVIEHSATVLSSVLLPLGPLSGAGFYAHALGPLPWSIDLGDATEVWVLGWH